MGDVIEDMLRKSMTALMTNDRKLTAEVSRMDNIVDRLDEAIKLYVTKITRGSLDDRDGRRATEIIAFAINLEHIGDIIDKNLMELAAKKIKHKGTSNNCHRSSGAPNLPANDSALFSFRFCAVHPKDVRDSQLRQLFEVPTSTNSRKRERLNSNRSTSA
jgi:Na+/phosphate symporter